MDTCETCGKPFPRHQLSAVGLRCETCDPTGIEDEGRATPIVRIQIIRTTDHEVLEDFRADVPEHLFGPNMENDIELARAIRDCIEMKFDVDD